MGKKVETKETLKRKIIELTAQLASSYNFAHATMDKTSDKYMMTSGVLLQLTALGGRELIIPVVIKDGLSPETIAAIKADMKRSYDLATMFKL